MTTMRSPARPDAAALLEVAEELAVTTLALARRFAAGGTLWCFSPGVPHHAHHVAVEFIHPVIVGKPSLPAVAIDDSVDPIATVRLLVRPGDALLVIGDGDNPTIASLLRRGQPWGLETVWLAFGPAPAAVADHVILVGDRDGGGLPLAYHLLWELTHVVFEHPGLLTSPDPPCRDDVCITCSDEGRVVEVRWLADEQTAVVLAGGQEEQVDLSLVTGAGPGDLLLEHAGLALHVLETAR